MGHAWGPAPQVPDPAETIVPVTCGYGAVVEPCPIMAMGSLSQEPGQTLSSCTKLPLAYASADPRLAVAPALFCCSRAAKKRMTEELIAHGTTLDHSVLDRGSRARLLRNMVVLAGSQVVTWTMSFAWTLVIPRALGPASMGLLVLNWSAIGVITVLAGLGTKVLLVREIAADRSRAPQLLGAAFYLRAMLLLPALGVTLLYVRVGGFDSQRTLFIVLAYAATVVVLFTEPVQAAFQGIERMEYLALGDVLIKTLGAVGAILLVLLGHGALSLVVLALALNGAVLVLYVPLIRRYVRLDLRFRWPSVVRLFRDSMAFWAFAVFFTLYLWIDAILLAVLAPSEVLGWYGLPTKLFGTLMFVPIIISTAWLPRLSAAFRRSPSAFWSTARPALEMVLLLSLPIGVGAALVAAPLINLLYGRGYEQSIPVFIVLACTSIPMYLNIVVNQVLVASRRQNVWTLVMVGASIVNPALNLLLIPHFQRANHNGAIGAALALLLTEALIMCAGLTLVRKVLTWDLGKRLIRGLLATGTMALAVVLVQRFPLVVQVGTGALSFGVVAVALRLISVREVKDMFALLRGGRFAGGETGG